MKSVNKNIDTGSSSALSRHYEKPFQQIVSHIKSRAQKIKIEDQMESCTLKPSLTTKNLKATEEEDKRKG
eukprot:CAMPEP_0170553230 /NCGR_PEP_ID=MMETSP0211-20121228/11030_1 /TAXON_ID=311385 /ORGANISM="Pseudokeronopsis sp., Strain OXSARD2" /LENGTH=69 /DNA_ID=CAMNT_0010861407 /DNA_START=1769 /DNA_END=1978 /DNA_ORIENTATION=+